MYAFFAFYTKNRAFTPFSRGYGFSDEVQNIDIRYTERSEIGTFFLTSERFGTNPTKKMSVKFFLANPKSKKSSIDAIVRFRGHRYKKGIGVSVLTTYRDAGRQSAAGEGVVRG